MTVARVRLWGKHDRGRELERRPRFRPFRVRPGLHPRAAGRWRRSRCRWRARSTRFRRCPGRLSTACRAFSRTRSPTASATRSSTPGSPGRDATRATSTPSNASATLERAAWARSSSSPPRVRRTGPRASMSRPSSSSPATSSPGVRLLKAPLRRLAGSRPCRTSCGSARRRAAPGRRRSSPGIPTPRKVRSGQIKAGDGFSHWLLKFDGVAGNRDRELEDPRGYGLIEYAYHAMARAAGIEMTECRILHENGRHHFMTRRFDRTDTGGQDPHAVPGCPRPLRLQPAGRVFLRAGPARHRPARARQGRGGRAVPAHGLQHRRPQPGRPRQEHRLPDGPFGPLAALARVRRHLQLQPGRPVDRARTR